MAINKIGLIGAGVMGVGLTQSLAQANYSVILLDISEGILKRARDNIANNVRLQRLFSKSQNLKSADDSLDRITFSLDYSLLSDVDFVIESVTEQWEAKSRVYAQIDSICPVHCVFATNTSAISVTRIASATNRPTKIIGMHFMNPVPMKPLVEVIPGYHTSEETIDIAKALLRSMGKEWVVVNDMPGFVSNRVLMLMINEAIFLLQDRVAQTEEIDRIFKSCFGHKMGPLETADLIGLDTILYSLVVLSESYDDPKFRPCPLLKKMVDAGLYGRKSGQGFYSYVQAGNAEEKM